MGAIHNNTTELNEEHNFDLWADGKPPLEKSIQYTLRADFPRLAQCVDLFSGGGGASEGFTNAGFEVVLAVDVWEPAHQIHRLNHPQIKTSSYELGGSIVEAAVFIRSHLKAGAHFHLHGSPPCQALSNASRTDNRDGLRLVNWFLDLVEYMKPDSWSMENVVPLGKFLRAEGIEHQIINAADYGVPQARKRVFAGEGWSITPSHLKEDWISVREALPELNKWPLLHMDAGRSSAKTSGVNPRTGKKEGGSGFLSKSIDNPSYTIMSSPKNLCFVEGLVEPLRFRSLTLEESATLQGWSSMKLDQTMKKKDQWVVVGNMVCPPVAEAIGRSIMEGLN